MLDCCIFEGSTRFVRGSQWYFRSSSDRRARPTYLEHSLFRERERERVMIECYSFIKITFTYNKSIFIYFLFYQLYMYTCTCSHSADSIPSKLNFIKNVFKIWLKQRTQNMVLVSLLPSVGSIFWIFWGDNSIHQSLIIAITHHKCSADQRTAGPGARRPGGSGETRRRPQWWWWGGARRRTPPRRVEPGHQARYFAEKIIIFV